jgi:hypothetical protein
MLLALVTESTENEKKRNAAIGRLRLVKSSESHSHHHVERWELCQELLPAV